MTKLTDKDLDRYVTQWLKYTNFNSPHFVINDHIVNQIYQRLKDLGYAQFGETTWWYTELGKQTCKFYRL
jgi:methionyl-tRNA synthetase